MEMVTRTGFECVPFKMDLSDRASIKEMISEGQNTVK